MQEIKNKAVSLFSEGRFEDALTLLWEMGSNEFIPYILNVQRKSGRPLWLEHEIAGKYFWETFILKPEIFNQIFESDYADDFLTAYFIRYDGPAAELIGKLADTYPDALVRAIRTNRVFLKPQWYEVLATLITYPGLKAHVIVWDDIRTIEAELWKPIDAGVSMLSDYTLQLIMAEIAIWLELKRYKQYNDHSTHFLSRIYSFFIEKILPLLPALDKRAPGIDSEDDFFGFFLREFARIKKSPEQSTPLFRLMNSVENWLYFYEKICEPYFYDLKLRPIIENDLRLLQTSPQYHYSGLIDGVRYQVIQFVYQAEGAEWVDYKENQGELFIPKGRLPEDENINRNIASFKYGTLFLLADLGIDHFMFNNKSFPADKILSPLITFSINRQIRYENALKKHSASTRDWFETYMKLTAEAVHQDIAKTPYLFMSVNDFIALNKYAVNTEPETSEAIIHLFGYAPVNSGSSRFDWQYDVWSTPLLKIDQFLFCPVMFWGTNIWFYSFIQKALLVRGKSHVYAKEIPQMEAYLGSCFEKKGWKTRVITSSEANKVEGDVDLIIEDEHNILLIQLKRTYLRLNIKDSYAESRMIDRKAADQLTKAEVYLSRDNPVYKLNQKPVKWIVSTSFEGVQSISKDCRKINYFELVLALKSSDIRTVNDFIAYLHNDRHLHAIYEGTLKEDNNETRSFLQSLGLPLPLFEPKSYKLPLASGNNEATEDYSRLFNEGLSFDSINEKNKAIEIFHKCTVLCESDAEAWSALANCLSDVKQYAQAFICFKKALTILPDDPFISRNYAFALIENQKYYEGISILIDIGEMYPLLGSIKPEIAAAIEKAIALHAVSANELEKISLRLKTLS